MLKLNVIQSPDPLMTGEIVFYFSKINIGRSKNNHISINDREIKSQDITLECHREGILIQSIRSESFLCNGKKIKGKKFLKINDVFQCGQTSFKVIEYNFETINQPIQFKDQYQKFIKGSPELLNILTDLEDELKKQNNNLL